MDGNAVVKQVEITVRPATVDDVKLTQLPSGQASVEVWLTYQDEKQALEVRI